MVIAIDGTSGSGKSSVARIIAEETAFELINTGKIYRKIAKDCLEKKISAEEETKVTEIAKSICLEKLEDSELHSEEISRAVPLYAKIPSVRIEVRKIQQELGNTKNIVVEGRDIGTVVFPNAQFKFFITATIEERARRRQKQLGVTGEDSLVSIMKNLEERDHQDEHRTSSPLATASDAEVIDTTELTLEEVVKGILKKVKEDA